MAQYTKDRSERLDYAHDFSQRLNGGEVISAIDALEIRELPSRNDVSAEFGNPASSAIVSGDEVYWELDEASSTSDQKRSYYHVYLRVLTSDNDLKVAVRNQDGDYPLLRVHQD